MLCTKFLATQRTVFFDSGVRVIVICFLTLDVNCNVDRRAKPTGEIMRPGEGRLTIVAHEWCRIRPSRETGFHNRIACNLLFGQVVKLAETRIIVDEGV